MPSGLCIEAWERWLEGYEDKTLVKILEYGWPINFDRRCGLGEASDNHSSALAHPQHVEFYIQTELGHQALAGPFRAPPFSQTHISPLMTRVKKDSDNRRVIMDLSWPQ